MGCHNITLWQALATLIFSYSFQCKTEDIQKTNTVAAATHSLSHWKWLTFLVVQRSLNWYAYADFIYKKKGMLTWVQEVEEEVGILLNNKYIMYPKLHIPILTYKWSLITYTYTMITFLKSLAKNENVVKQWTAKSLVFFSYISLYYFDFIFILRWCYANFYKYV